MEEIHLAYRTESFSPFVHTLREVARDTYDLNVEVTLVRGTEDAEKDLCGGEVDAIIGHHFTPFVSKITGQNLTWLAIAQNRRDYKLVTRPGVRSFKELTGKSIAVANNLCMGLNMQLVIRDMGLEGKVVTVGADRRGRGPRAADRSEPASELDLLQSGKVDAALVDVPADLEARRRGFVVHQDTPVLDIVAGECVTTIPRIIAEREPVLRAFMRAYLHAVSIFTTRPDYLKQLILNNPKIVKDLKNRFRTEDEDLLERFIKHWGSRWERKPYPNLRALTNTLEKATRYDARCAGVNPLTVVDTHYVKELDEEGFIDRLYV